MLVAMTKGVNQYGDTQYQFGSLASASSAVGIYFNSLITAFFEVIDKSVLALSVLL
jgi:hypothetical protein